jgi:hypothetical protein
VVCQSSEGLIQGHRLQSTGTIASVRRAVDASQQHGCIETLTAVTVEVTLHHQLSGYGMPTKHTVHNGCGL